MNLRSITDRFARLSARERRLLSTLGAALGFLLFVGLPIGLIYAVHSRRSEVDDLRTALDDVQKARAHVRERQMRKDAIASRYARKAPALAGFIEEKARAQKLEVTDSVDRPELPHGKKFTERNTVIHLKKSGLGPISKFLETIETSNPSPSPVIASRLDLRKRSGEPDSYDVEIGISAYDKVEKAEATTSPAPGGSASP